MVRLVIYKKGTVLSDYIITESDTAADKATKLSSLAAQVRWQAEEWQFQDTLMDSQYISLDAKSEYPIEWQVGDFCYYRGVPYTLNQKPSVTQQARQGEYGEAFEYSDLKFESALADLNRCTILDITPTTGDYEWPLGENYTGSASFTLQCCETNVVLTDKSKRTTTLFTPVEYLAGVIKANLDRLFPDDHWQIEVETANTHTDDTLITFNNTSAMDALKMVKETFSLYYCVIGRTIYIGYDFSNLTSTDFNALNNQTWNEDPTKYFEYGKGKGIYQIEKKTSSDKNIITRLRAMGSKRNLPYRYYNTKYSASLGNSGIFIQNLQLPDAFAAVETRKENNITRRTKGYADVLGESVFDCYLDKDNDAANCEEGIWEGVGVWDGSDNDHEEIYPTIEDVTYGELRDAGIADHNGNTGSSAFPGYGNDEYINEIEAVDERANLGDGIIVDFEDTGEDQNASIVPLSGSGNLTYSLIKGDSGILTFKAGAINTLQTKGEYELSVESGVAVKIAMPNVTNETFSQTKWALHFYATDSDENILAEWTTDSDDCVFVGEADTEAGTSYQYIDLPSLPYVNDGISRKLTLSDETKLNFYVDVYNLSGISSGGTFNVELYNRVGGKCQGSWKNANMGTTYANTAFSIYVRDFGLDFSNIIDTGEDPTLSMKSGTCVACDFKLSSVSPAQYLSDKEERLVWKLTFERCWDDSIGAYYPSEKYPIAVGDKFVILNVELPELYIKAAEIRLLAAATKYLKKVQEQQYTYNPTLDDIYVQKDYDENGEQSIYWNLYAGLKFPLKGIPTVKDAELPNQNVLIKSVTIKEGGLTPDIEVNLDDELEETIQQRLNNTISRLSSDNSEQVASSISALRKELSSNTAKYALKFYRGGNLIAAYNGATEVSVPLEYLSRKEADTAQEVITFLKGLTSDSTTNINGVTNINAAANIKGLATLFNTLQSDNFFDNFNSGTGWGVTRDGNMQVESIEVRSYMKVLELVFNRLSAEESEYVFTESGTIDNVETLSAPSTKTITDTEGNTKTVNTGGTYRLTMRKKTDTDFTAFHAGDVIRGVVNDLTDSTKSVGKSYYTSWMYIRSVDVSTNQIIAIGYDDDEVPAQKNFAPKNLMVIHRWGNQSDTSRQSCWYISSIEKRIAMLDGVTKPIIEESNYAAFFGLPYNMTSFKDKAVNAEQPYIYCRGAFLENVFHVDYKGQVVRSERFRGLWSATTAASDDPYVLTDTTYDTVYYNNAKWQCIVEKAGTDAPVEGTKWLKLYDGIVPRYTIVPSVERVIRDAEGNPNVSVVKCDVILEDATGQTSAVLQKDKKVYYTKNKLEASLTEGREVSIVKNDGTNTIEFYLYNNDSDLGNITFGSSIFAYLTCKTTVEVIMQGSVSLITNTVIWYAVTDDNKQPTSGWSKDMPTVENGKFLWTWTHIEYSDRDATDSYSVSRVGMDGNGVKDSNIKYHQTTDNNPIDANALSDDDWHLAFPSDLKEGCWLYTRTWIKYVDEKETVSISCVQIGTGSSYAGVQELYALGSDGNTSPEGYPDAGTYTKDVNPAYNDQIWKQSHPTEDDWKLSLTTPYIWNFEISYDSAGNKYVTPPVCIGNFSKGIKSIVEAYAISAYSAPDVEGADYPSDIVEVEEGEDVPEGKHAWTDEQQDAAPTEDYPYQWNKTKTTYTDGTTEDHYHVSAVKGTKGDSGVNVIVSATNISAKKSSSAQTFYVTVKANQGGVSIPYDSSNFVCSNITNLVGLTITKAAYDANTCRYTFVLSANTTINVSLPFSVTINGISYAYEIIFSTTKDGDSIQGPRGATIRISEYKVGNTYHNGATDDYILDVVYMTDAPETYYYCISSFTAASTDATPIEDAKAGVNAVHWKTFDHFEAIATKILFAERGKIDNADLTNVTLRGTITEETEETLDYFHVVGTGCTNKYEDGKNYTLKSVYVNNAMTQPYVLDVNGNIQYDEGIPLTDGEDFPSNRIIMLPTFEGMSINNEIVIPSYKNAGAHLNIYSTPINNVMNWSICDETDWQLQYNLLKTLFDKAVLVCADPCSLISNGDGGVKAGWNNSQVFDTYNENYVQGRFSWNGVMARCLILLPGQSLHLISSVQEVTMLKDEGETTVKTLVWNIDNSSDFQGINAYIDEGTSVEYLISSVPTHISGVAETSANAILLSGKGFQWDEKALLCPMRISVTPIDGETQKLPQWSVDTFEITE